MHKTLFKSRSADAQPAGKQLWKHIVNNSRNSVSDGLPKWFMDTYNNDEQEIGKKMTKELDIYFANDYEFDFDNHWDRHLPDWTIKEKHRNYLNLIHLID